MEDWQEKANEAMKAARVCLRRGHNRSAVSRAYYAIFSAATYRLRQLSALGTPPLDREHWGHERTPFLLQQHLGGTMDRQTLNEVTARLCSSYRKRITADYETSMVVNETTAERCVADAEAVLNELLK